MTETKTNQITIVVQPNYIPERSDPSRPVFFFAYHITITNEGKNRYSLKTVIGTLRMGMAILKRWEALESLETSLT